jgi:PII-like signaling protein
MARPQDSLLVRIYLTESRAHVDRLLSLLRKSGKLRGLTVFHGVAGFGTSLDPASGGALLLDPPVVLEFFEGRANAADVIAYVRTLVAPNHVVAWPVDVL